MAVSMKSARVAVASRATVARPSVVVRAAPEQVDRRGLLGLVAGVVGASLMAPKDASAIGLPWQESTGGMVKGGGSVTKSATAASAEGYTLDGFPGTKKPSYIKPSKRKALLAKVRNQAEKNAS